jgi:hypothetical protein
LTIIEMIDASERQAFELLPEVTTIYRGCGLENRSGRSWTLDRSVAERVPFVQRYATEVPMLLTASIHKGAAAALKLGRLDREEIVFGLSEKDWTEEVITALCAKA